MDAQALQATQAKVEAAAVTLGRFSSTDLERKGFSRSQVRQFIRRRCVGDGCRPDRYGYPVSLWKVRERAS